MFDKVKSDLLASMKEQDKFKLGVLRMLKSALQMEQINIGHDLTDEETLAVIRREVKKEIHQFKSMRNLVKKILFKI